MIKKKFIPTLFLFYYGGKKFGDEKA